MQHTTGEENADNSVSERTPALRPTMFGTSILPLGRKQWQRRLLRLPRRPVWGSSPTARRVVAWVARGVELSVIALGWLVLPIWPLVAAVIARDAAYLKDYPRTLVGVVRHIGATWRAHAIERLLIRRLGATTPAESGRIAGECTHCGNCCLYRSCIFLSLDAQGQSSCNIYGGRVWDALACGDYPLDREDIALYRCPSFEVVPVSAGTDAKVIPIFPATVPGLAAVATPTKGRAGRKRTRADSV